MFTTLTISLHHSGNKTLFRFVILQAKKFQKCDWLRQVVFEPNLKYLHVENYSFHGDLNDRNNMAEIFPKCDEKNYKK